MKAIILAAGMGTRLGSVLPKPLTEISNGKSIFDFQVEKISKIIGEDNIVIVVGYKKEIIMEKYPNLLYAYNSAFTQTNTAKSLLTAVRKLDDDVVWLNGDVYFDEEVLKLLISQKNSACLVNKSKCAEEEIKYTVDEDGNIKELSKTVKNALGEAVGINLIKKEDVANFKEALEEVLDKDYFEKALENLTLAGKLKLLPIDLGNAYCKEIDFPEDLAEVREHLKK